MLDRARALVLAREKLLQIRPENAVYLAKLARAHAVLGELRDDAGLLAAAARSYELALEANAKRGILDEVAIYKAFEQMVLLRRACRRCRCARRPVPWRCR